ncbi:ATP-binding protein [Kribbella monticola]|uniref:ATP-binding protein n=1 Tax=Kribbella monticola TaxID=2185285 RepID=UPI0018E4FD4F|nr:ATP-binding protein [Kribbella monticola]
MTSMLWIGGAPGAGKSTIARQLARAGDLPLHPVDLWTYDHLERLPAYRLLAEKPVEGPQGAAEVFVEISRVRLPVILEDVHARGLGEVPALVEGPQLFPSMLGPAVRAAIWLVPDASLTRKAREERLDAVDDPQARARLDSLLARDEILARWVWDEVTAAGLPLIEVDPDPDWNAITARVETTLGDVQRLQAGDELSRQRKIENTAACRQLRLWRADRGFADLPMFPFACECGRSGCTSTVLANPDQYEELSGDRLLAPQHGATRSPHSP